MKTANKTLTVTSGAESRNVQVASSLDGSQSAFGFLSALAGSHSGPPELKEPPLEERSSVRLSAHMLRI
jgi:hypothetical protein